MTTATLLIPAMPSYAANRYWIDSDGGLFNSAFNWSSTSGGAGGASFPVAGDAVFFDQNFTTEIDFSSGATTTNSAVDIRAGNYSFDLNFGTYILTSGAALDIGNVPGTTARLTIFEGTLEPSNQGNNITLGLGSTGYLTVSHSAQIGTDASRMDLIVGSTGTGIMTIEDDGRVDAFDMLIGSGSSSSGTLTLSDPLSVVTTGRFTRVGSGGTGNLRIFSGADFFSQGSTFTVGNSLGSEGSVTVSGSGSLLDITSSAQIGNSGNGTLSISSGGRTVARSSLRISAFESSSGAASVSGSDSRLEVAGTLEVGDEGAGTLTVFSGGDVNSASGFIGSGLNSTGMATISGAGSRWSNLASLTVGASGEGELAVTNGGTVTVNSNLTLANGASSSGLVSIAGQDSKIIVDGTLFAGVSGAGTLSVTDSAELYVGEDLSIDPLGGVLDSTLNLDGGSIYVDDDFSNESTFNFKDGLLQVVGNFNPNGTTGPFILDGESQDDLPTLSLLGSGTTGTISTISVGENRRGSLLLGQGRILDLANEPLSIAVFPGSEGTTTVASGAQVITTGMLAVGGASNSVAGGAGTLNIQNGTVDIGTLRLFDGGVINLDGGTLTLNSMATFNGQFNWSSGDFDFDGDINLDAQTAWNLTGPFQTLLTGQSLGTKLSSQTITLDTPLTLDGGSLTPGHLNNNSILNLQSGSAFVNGIASNAGTLIFGHPLATFGGNNGTNNQGTIRGGGILSGNIANTGNGRIEVSAGEDLLITNNLANDAAIDINSGSLRINGIASIGASTGIISLRNALLTLDNGITNNGALVAGGGISDVFGDLNTTNSGQVILSGGATVIFHDDVTNNGTFNVSAAGSLSSTAIFFGALTGNGIGGSGAVFIEGDARPGFSPGIMSFSGNVSFGPFAKLECELGGPTPGTEHDKLDVNGDLFLNGQLEVTLINGFTPTAGMSFDLWNAGTASGGFTSLILPPLPDGLFWHTSEVNLDGTLSVSVTPEVYADWAAYYGLTTPPGGSEDSDLLSNVIEYALGLNPLSNDSSNPAAPQYLAVAPNDQFSFEMPILSAPDVEIEFQTGIDLLSWDVLATRSAGGPWTGSLLPVLTPAGPGMETVTVTRPRTGDPLRFYRLHVRLLP